MEGVPIWCSFIKKWYEQKLNAVGRNILIGILELSDSLGDKIRRAIR
jgi:hypothetical protein